MFISKLASNCSAHSKFGPLSWWKLGTILSRILYFKKA